jgi:hypothetical protein
MSNLAEFAIGRRKSSQYHQLHTINPNPEGVYVLSNSISYAKMDVKLLQYRAPQIDSWL